MSESCGRREKIHTSVSTCRDVKTYPPAEDMNSNNSRSSLPSRDEKDTASAGVERFLIHLRLGYSIILFPLISLQQAPQL